jgi:hypothetical protein
LQRWGLAWAAAFYVGGMLYGPGLLEQVEPPPSATAPPEIPSVELPEVDVEKLTPEQERQWREVRERFVITARRVHQARELLEQLAARLRSQNMSLNQQDVAVSLMMQGFLEDSASLIRAGQFQLAKEALTRAEYQRHFESLAKASALVRILNLAYAEGFNAALQQLRTTGNGRTM